MGSPTFATSLITPNATFDPSKDNVTPSLRLLNLKAMPETTALAGVTGTEVMVNHGDSDTLIERNNKLHVELSMTELVDQNHENTVTGNKTQTVVGVTHQTFVAHHEQTNIATRVDHFVHTRTELHSQPEMVQQPTSTSENVNEKNEQTYKVFEYRNHLIEMSDTSLDLKTLVDMAVKNRDMTLSFVSAEGQAFKHEIHGLRNNLSSMFTEIHGLKLKAAGSHAKAIAANLNAGFAANADSPVA